MLIIHLIGSLNPGEWTWPTHHLTLMPMWCSSHGWLLPHALSINWSMHQLLRGWERNLGCVSWVVVVGILHGILQCGVKLYISMWECLNTVALHSIITHIIFQLCFFSHWVGVSHTMWFEHLWLIFTICIHWPELCSTFYQDNLGFILVWLLTLNLCFGWTFKPFTQVIFN